MPNFIINPKIATNLMSADFGFPLKIDLPLAVPRFPQPSDPNPSKNPHGFNPNSDRDFNPPGLNTKDIIHDIKIPVSGSYCIALIDTGVNETHHDLNPKYITLLSANGDDDDVKDQYGHGSHIAGILSANGNGTDTIQGMVPDAPIVSYKITRKESSETRWTCVANALEMVIDYNADPKNKPISVVNLSFNGFDNVIGDEGMREHKLYRKILQLHKANIPVVVSGGNYFDQFFVKTDGAKNKLKQFKQSYGLAYPANFEYVIACGASCIDGNLDDYRMRENELAPFTQRIAGDSSSKNMFFTAPAIATYSTGLNQDRLAMTGSSMAAPVITGIVFLLQLYAKSQGIFPNSFPPVQVIKEALRRGSEGSYNTRGSEFSNRAIGNRYAECFDGKEYLHVNATNILREFKNMTQSLPHR